MKSTLRSVPAALLVCLVWPTPASADAAPSPSSPNLPPPALPQPSQEAPQRAASYPGTIVIADLAALGLSALLATEARAGWASVAPWLIASPFVHAIHRNPQGSALSFLLYGGLPSLLGLVGYLAERSDCQRTDESVCGLIGLVVGGLVGAVAATTIDAVFLAREPVPAKVASRSSFSLWPTVSVAREGTPSVGVVGVF